MIAFRDEDEEIYDLLYTSVVSWSSEAVEKTTKSLVGNSIKKCLMKISFERNVAEGDFINFYTLHGIISFKYNGVLWKRQ